MSELISLCAAVFVDEPTPATELGARGELVWLPIDHLYIDTAYQRAVLGRGRRNIRRIIEGFRWEFFSPLVVSKRGPDQYAIIDGQHHAMAAKSHGGITHVPCLIVETTKHIEARAFAIINGQVTAVLPTQIYRARLEGGEAGATALQKVLDAAGVRVLKYPTPAYEMKVGDTLSISTLETCMKLHGRDVLIAALQCITQTGNGNAGFVRAPAIYGLCDALAKNARWVDAGEALFTAIETVGIPLLYRKAETIRHQNGGALRARFAEVIRAHLTEKLPRLKVAA